MGGWMSSESLDCKCRLFGRKWFATVLLLLFSAAPGYTNSAEAMVSDSPPGLLAAVPFVLLLLGIGLFPLILPHVWHYDSIKVLFTMALSVPVALLLPAETTQHALLEYFAFMALIGSLFVVAGNIHLEATWRGTPLTNTALLAVGAILANLLGTTGASMLLIRVLLGTNRGRSRQVHLVIFFIFIVSNTAGLLTPLGDPPLFLGFLHGVPFTWTFGLMPQWLFVNGTLLGLFWLIDTRLAEKTTDMGSGQSSTVNLAPGTNQLASTLFVQGEHNLFFLLGIVAAVLLKGRLGEGMFSLVASGGLMLLMGGLSIRTTPAALRRLNGFSWGPVLEVGILFAGLFVTMGPAIQILEHKSPELGIHHAWQYFWLTGMLSSLLDNAPTYVAFASLALGGSGLGSSANFGDLAHWEGGAILAAISCGAVFMGANTYIGNGPNFMVKSIAESQGVRMPGFFGYMIWSGAILVPLFGLCSLLFF